jgi:hypothetical protein
MFKLLIITYKVSRGEEREHSEKNKSSDAKLPLHYPRILYAGI